MSEPEKYESSEGRSTHQEIEVTESPQAESAEAVLDDPELAALLDSVNSPEVHQNLQEEIEKWREIAARSQADLENYRKRVARERSEAIQYANNSLLSSLLPVIDSFDMGLKAARQEGENSMIYKGMVMVHKQMNDFLVENKVVTIEVAEGSPFDPNVHEAIQEEFSDSVEEGKVLATLRRGYILKDRLLRPANVVVSKGSQCGGDNQP